MKGFLCDYDGSVVVNGALVGHFILTYNVWKASKY